MDFTPAQKEALAKMSEEERREVFLPPRRQEINELAKATTANQGNRKQRRRLQAQFKKHVRSHI
ncbi:hypothetical protein [Mesorhizobium sp. WSM2239]|uniref:Uncharacterized protein n=2 Tax=unclassified Mesorhizobium TaxID=325217 RepID=A0AAU8D204_9HYPH